MNVRMLLCFGLGLCVPACGSDSTDAGDVGCTLIGCTDGFSVAFEASTWEPGDYRVDVLADGMDYACETTMPFTADGPVTCSSSDVMLEISGTALPAAQQSIAGVRLFLFADNVRVTISRDGLPLSTQEFFPEYETIQPNGPECEPTCRNDDASMSL